MKEKYKTSSFIYFLFVYAFSFQMELCSVTFGKYKTFYLQTVKRHSSFQDSVNRLAVKHDRFMRRLSDSLSNAR